MTSRDDDWIDDLLNDEASLVQIGIIEQLLNTSSARDFYTDINLTKLIDSFIKVAIHMRNKLKEAPYLEFDDYVAIYGVNIITSDGILETEGGWKDEKLYPFFEWTDEYKDSYGLRQGKVLKAIFDVLSKDKVDDSKIVSIVEDIDMWFNS